VGAPRESRDSRESPVQANPAQASPLPPLPAGADPEAHLAGLGIQVLHLAVPDTSGTLRQKRFPLSRAAAVIRDGWSFIEAVQWWDTADGLSAMQSGADRGWAHAPAEVDTGSLRGFPFERGAAVALADFTGPAGELSARRVLERLIRRAAALGLTAKLAFETEVILLEGTSDDQAEALYARPRAVAAANRCWSGVTLASHADLIRNLDATLAAGGVQLDHLCAELGPGCFEFATCPRDPLAAADDLAFLKLYTKAWCHRNGLTASFMAKLADEFPGLGCHPVLSLHDATGGDVLAGAGEEHGLSKTGLHAVAGIVSVLPELALLAAPTVNSYRRLAPGNWAPRTATWGIGNYTCGLRVIPDATSAGSGPSQGASTPFQGAATRLELRVPGADVNPWLAAALALGGAVYGIERRLLPPQPATGPARDLVPAELGELPRTLLEAAERFAASEIARDLTGETFATHYAATRIEEDRQMRRHVPAAERARYLDQVLASATDISATGMSRPAIQADRRLTDREGGTCADADHASASPADAASRAGDHSRAGGHLPG
jgi:glutamine synthetase